MEKSVATTQSLIPAGSVPRAEVWPERLTRWGTSLLRLLPAELSHDLGMSILARGGMNLLPPPSVDCLAAAGAVDLPGPGRLAHPIGLAAGFDKNALCLPAMQRLGFSFVEAGTVTPRPQPGNPKPRLFRQKDSLSLVNRMGFNNDGSIAVADRLRVLQNRTKPVGINIGKNKDTPLERAIEDYISGMEAFRGLADYYVVNISSPNTPGLRKLASPEFVDELADALPNDVSQIWIKLDPDLDRSAYQKIVAKMVERQYQGLILTNTHRVEWPETGGQSGHSVLAQSTACLEWAYEVHRGELPMIGCGGIMSGADVFQKLIRGATAVQIYTALVYRGPWVVSRLLTELAAELSLRGAGSVQEVIGAYYNDQAIGR